MMSDQSDEKTISVAGSLSRYSRQVLFSPIGEDGQRRLLSSRAVLIGCGALGTVLANTLVRAGLGFLRICDRDFIERDNLQRQILFDEDDLAANLPKAEAAAAKLRRINPEVTVEPVVTDVHAGNIEALARDADVLLDGTDNFETRFLMNEVAVKTSRPWIYGAVVGATGLCLTVIPGETACLRCVFEEAPPPEFNPTCDTAGVLGPAVNIVASFQAIEAMKLLTGRRDLINRHLISIDVWTGRVRNLNVQSAFASGGCPTCRGGEFPYLNREVGSYATSLCGRDVVQVHSGRGQSVDLAGIASKLASVACEPVRQNRFLLRAVIGDKELTLFADGRAIIKGTNDPDAARTFYAKYVGA